MKSFFTSIFENNKQGLVIRGHNRLFARLPYPLQGNYEKLEENGICSADTTVWVRGKIGTSPSIRENYIINRRKLADLAYKTEKELDDFIAADKKELITLLDFGKSLQKLQNGTKYAGNMEQKHFQQDMMSVWLYSLPLVATPEVVKTTIGRILKPYHIYRFFSEDHIIILYAESETVTIFDPNDSSSEKDYDIDNISGIYSYLTKRFAAINVSLEAVEVFIPLQNNNPDLNPVKFEEFKFYLRGTHVPTNLFSSSFTLFLHDLKQAINALFKDKNWSSSYQQAMEWIDYLDTHMQLFNNYEIALDQDFINDIIYHLNYIKQFIAGNKNLFKEKAEAFSTKTIFYLTLFQKIKPDFDTNNQKHCVGIDYLIRSIGCLAITHLKYLKDYPEENKVYAIYEDTLKKIIFYAETYTKGSNSLEEIIINLKQLIDCLMRSNEYFNTNYAWVYNQLIKFIASWEDLKLKNESLQLINEHAVIKPNSRNNLFAAIHLSDSASVRFLLETKKYDVNSVSDDRAPIQIAVGVNNEEIVHMLILYGANVNVRDKKKNTLMHHDNALGNPAMADLILKANFSRESMYFSVKIAENHIVNAVDILMSRVNHKIELETTLKIIEKILEAQLQRNILTETDHLTFLNIILKHGYTTSFINFINQNEFDERTLSSFFHKALEFKNIEVVVALSSYFTNDDVYEKIEITIAYSKDREFINELLMALYESGNLKPDLESLINSNTSSTVIGNTSFTGP